jgi:hypothetical protein
MRSKGKTNCTILILIVVVAIVITGVYSIRIAPQSNLGLIVNDLVCKGTTMIKGKTEE